MKQFFAIMAVAFMAIVLTGCNTKIGDEDMEIRKEFSKMSAGDVTSVIENNIWYYGDGKLEFQLPVESGVRLYNNDTTYTFNHDLTSLSFKEKGKIDTLSWKDGDFIYFRGDEEIKTVRVREYVQGYEHVLDKVSGNVQQFWNGGEVVLKSGRVITSPERNPQMKYEGVPTVTFIANSGKYNYYSGKMDYTVTIDSVPSVVSGYKTLAVDATVPEDTLIDVEEGEEDFEPLTYDKNGNLKTGRSWKKLIPVYSESGKHEAIPFEVVLNFSVKGVSRATEDGDNFDGIKEIGSGLTSEDEAFNRNENEIKVYTLTSEYNSGVRFSGKDYNKSFTMSRERATVTYGGKTFNMPSPSFVGVKTNFSLSSEYESSDYKCKLNIITLNGKINGKDFSNVKAETELRVKPETFTLTVVDSAFVYINPTTSDTKIVIRETGNKGTVRQYERDVHVYNGIDDLGCVTVDVNEFDSKSSEGKLDDNDVYVGKRESGEFTVYKYMQGYTTGSENVDEYFRPYYERAYHNPTGTWMMWRKYENFVDNGFTTTDLSDETVGAITYLRKKYVYSMSATYNGHNDSAIGEAILRVVSDDDPQPVDPRVTPSWLGDPQWAEYTRVQKSEGAYFEDMVVYGYAEGVVLAPKGVADLTNGVFAYDQSVADAHGVQKCARGSAYTAVWKNNGWIPAKCETQNSGKSNETWIYTGRGVSHSVMANNAITLHIGTNVTWNPGEEVTISDGTITVKYSKNNASLNGNDLVSLK